jgi:lipopolysaccharide export system protein LptA
VGRIAGFVAVLLVLSAPAVQAQPGGNAGGALEVEGATYAELDEGTGLLTLRGQSVAVRHGDRRMRAPSIIYDTKQHVLRASGGVVFADQTITVEAPEVTVWIDEDRLVADGGVAAVQGQDPDAIRVRTARLEVFRRERRAVATGSVEVIAQDTTLTGDRVDAAFARDELSAEGNARIARADIEGRAPRVLLRRGEGIAVLSGGATVRQGINEAHAETITVDLRRRRVTASGRASLTLHPSR